MKTLIEDLTKECRNALIWSNAAWDKAETLRNDPNAMQSMIYEALYLNGQHEALLTTLDRLQKL